MNSKQKVFINYFSGASGHFFGSICWMLLSGEHLNLTRPNMALEESCIMNQYHNLASFWDRGLKQRQFDLLSTEAARSLIKFYSTPYNFYIAYLHKVDPEPILLSVDNAKLISIELCKECGDLDQVAWNWLTKTGIHQPLNLNKKLRFLQTVSGKLLHIDSVDQSSDIELLFYIAKFTMIYGYKKHLYAKQSQQVPSFGINFKDIMSGQFKNNIKGIADFLEVEPNPDVIKHISQVIDEYVASQTVPPEIDFDYFN